VCPIWGLQALGLSLSTNRNLRSLDLSGSTVRPEGIIHIMNALCVNKALRHLRISSALATAEDATALAHALEVNVTLQSLDISGSSPGVLGLRALARALAQNTTLAELGLASVICNATDAQEVAKGLATNQGLETLDLTNSRFAPKLLGPSGVRYLTKALKLNRFLQSLNLTNSICTVEDAAEFGEAIRANRTLTTLDISGNELNELALTCLVDALKSNINIRTLRVDKVLSNRLQKARKLHDAVSTLRRNDPTLVDVNLEACIDTEEQAADIVTALSENTIVKSLGLQKNRLGTTTLRRLFGWIATSQTLTSLNVEGCIATDDEFRMMVRQLRHHYDLSLWQLRRCYGHPYENCSGSVLPHHPPPTRCVAPRVAHVYRGR